MMQKSQSISALLRVVSVAAHVHTAPCRLSHVSHPAVVHTCMLGEITRVAVAANNFACLLHVSSSLLIMYILVNVKRMSLFGLRGIALSVVLDGICHFVSCSSLLHLPRPHANWLGCVARHIEGHRVTRYP